MKYQFSQGTENEDGSFTIPAEKAQRWKRQMETNYTDLTEKEKDSDRQIAFDFFGCERPKICEGCVFWEWYESMENRHICGMRRTCGKVPVENKCEFKTTKKP